MSEARDDELALPRILVVDDLYANRVAMRRLLVGIEAEIVEADNGNDALAACLSQEFALILLDVQMPGMDGFEVAEFLSGEESTRGVAIIFVTAGASDELDCVKGYDVGAFDYITKPISAALLSGKVRKFVELYNGRKALESAYRRLDDVNQALQHEVEERRHAEAQAQYMATHDPLCGLPNRLLFLDRLNVARRRSQRNQRAFVVGYLDLDGFKPVNDAYGHRAGDAVLQAIAERLIAQLRDSDTAARFGGDEFAIILEGISDPAACIARCQSLRDALAEPITVPTGYGEVAVRVGVSIGLAFSGCDLDTADTLMHQADCALYAVKNNGKADVRVFDPSTDER